METEQSHLAMVWHVTGHLVLHGFDFLVTQELLCPPHAYPQELVGPMLLAG